MWTHNKIALGLAEVMDALARSPRAPDRVKTPRQLFVVRHGERVNMKSAGGDKWYARPEYQFGEDKSVEHCLLTLAMLRRTDQTQRAS